MAATKTLIRSLTATALAIAAGSALSASVTWSTGPTFNGPTGYSGILTNGTLVEAVNMAGFVGIDLTVNPAGLNLTFVTRNSTSFEMFHTGAGAGGNTDAGWAAILNTFEWSNSNFTAASFLTGLTVGHEYQVQFFASRSDCCGARTLTLGDGEGHLSTPTSLGSYTSIVGTFIAGASTQTIQFTDTDHAPSINAYVLRELSAPVPEPGTWALMAAGLLAVGRIARRRQG